MTSPGNNRENGEVGFSPDPETLQNITEAPIFKTKNFDEEKYAEFLIAVTDLIRQMKKRTLEETGFRGKIAANRQSLESHSDEQLIDYVNNVTGEALAAEPYFYRALAQIIAERSLTALPDTDPEDEY